MLSLHGFYFCAELFGKSCLVRDDPIAAESHDLRFDKAMWWMAQEEIGNFLSEPNIEPRNNPPWTDLVGMVETIVFVTQSLPPSTSTFPRM